MGGSNTTVVPYAPASGTNELDPRIAHMRSANPAYQRYQDYLNALDGGSAQLARNSDDYDTAATAVITGALADD